MDDPDLEIRVIRMALIDRVAEELARSPFHATHRDRAASVVDLLSQPSLRPSVVAALLGISTSETASLGALLERIEVDESGSHLLSVALAARAAMRKVVPLR